MCSDVANSDPIKLTLEAVRQFGPLVANLLASASKAGGKKLKTLIDKLTIDYREHLEATHNRCTKIKTLLNLDEPVELLSLYQNTKFKCENRDIDDYDLIREIREKKRAIISGTGGGGKTIFMKYLWLSFFVDPRGRIPLFVELRRLNDITSVDLGVYIFTSIAATSSEVSKEIFDNGLKEGLFIFILDGFDEINAEKRSEIERQILELGHNNPKCIIVVSGRPDDRFQSWQSFSIYKVRPLDQKSVIALVGKLNYDKATKKKFVERVKSDLFKQHSSFLSTPLLATLMLLTFNQYADIPEKIHVFYEQAFDTLYARHDAIKETFKRKMFSNLQIDVFKRYLSFFCLLSYYDGKYEFSEEEITKLIETSLKMDDVKIDVPNFLKDLMESTCILQRDGAYITFTHRSFQEFFAAYCLARTSIKEFKAILQHIAQRFTDNVIPMLFEMNSYLVENEYVLPLLRGIARQITSTNEGNVVEDHLRIFGDSLLLILAEGYAGVGTSPGNDNWILLCVLRRLYPAVFAALRDGIPVNIKDPKLLASIYKTVGRPKTKNMFVCQLNIKTNEVMKGGDAKAVPKKLTPSQMQKWLTDSGYTKRCANELESLQILLKQIESRHAKRDRSTAEIFGIAE